MAPAAARAAVLHPDNRAAKWSLVQYRREPLIVATVGTWYKFVSVRLPHAGLLYRENKLTRTLRSKSLM